MALVDEPAHEVALGDVRGLVGHDPGQFVLVARGQDQPAVDGDESPRHGKRVDDRIADDEVIELMLTLFGAARKRMADLLDVGVDLGVLQHGAALAHLPEPAEARLVFVFEGYRRIRRAAELRQVLIGRAQARGPAQADARTDRDGGRKGRQRFPQLTNIHHRSLECPSCRKVLLCTQRRRAVETRSLSEYFTWPRPRQISPQARRSRRGWVDTQ